jgi:hypothetical protein
MVDQSDERRARLYSNVALHIPPIDHLEIAPSAEALKRISGEEVVIDLVIGIAANATYAIARHALGILIGHLHKAVAAPTPSKDAERPRVTLTVSHTRFRLEGDFDEAKVLEKMVPLLGLGSDERRP